MEPGAAQLGTRLHREFRRGALLHLVSGRRTRRTVIGVMAESGLRHCAGQGLDAVDDGVPAGRRRQLAGMPGRMARTERQRRTGPDDGAVLSDHVLRGDRLRALHRQHVLHPAGYDARCAGHVRGVLHRQPDPLDPRQYRGRRPLRRGPLLASQQEIIGKIVRQRKSMNS